MAGEIEVRQEGLALLSDNPEELVKRATRIANALGPIIEQKKLYSMISGKKYVRVEGWTTLGAMLGLFPFVTEVKRVSESDGEIAFNARVELRTMDGRAISAAEAMCSNAEKGWKGRDKFAIESQSQTRATGKVLRLPLAWIMTLAGYEATPAEEMTNGETSPPPEKDDKTITDKQLKFVIAKQHEAEVGDDVFKHFLKTEFNITSRKLITKGSMMDAVLAWFEEQKQYGIQKDKEE